MTTSYNFADAQRLLIKPFERLEFVIIFVLTTALIQVVASLLFSQPTFYLLWERSQMQYGLTTGLITGMFVGASQWLILRKYVSDWKWILVVGLNTTFITSINIAVGILKESVISSVANGLSGQEIHLAILATTVMFLISLGSIFIVGYLQWYVLRPYVTKARWWILIPFIAGLAGGGLFIIEFLSSGLLRFNRDVLNMTMLPITQAIGFCILKKRFVSEHPTLQSPLALATDIVNYWDVQKLQKILYTRISRIWKTDIRTSIGQLTYLIGVNHSGAMIYEPMNQASIDNVDRTPLPELASNPSFAASETEGLTDFAKFHVVFTPPGTFQIYSWRGIPLIWLGVAVYSGIIGISILCVW